MKGYHMDKQIDTEKKDTYNSIKDIMNKARTNVSRQVNNIIIQSYWEIGRIIVEDEQGNSDRAEYGRQLITDLSKRLTKDYGKGFSRSNLQNMFSNLPDTVWQIDLVTLLRVIVNKR